MDNNQVYDASFDAEMEERSVGTAIRDNSELIKFGDKTVGKITEYKFKILIRDKEPLEGVLTREEMDKIYRLYSAEGLSLTQRTVSQNFPQYTFQDFKRILRAFNITKASSPMAPHIIEEKSTEDLIQLTFQNKENNYLKKLEQDRAKLNENRLKEVIKENIELKQVINSGKHFISNIDFTPVKFQVNTNPNASKTLLLYLSDMHIGAYVSSEGIYDNEYNEIEAQRRLQRVFEVISRIKDLNEIIVLNLGDAIDGMNSQTTRPSSNHILPQNMSNKEQGKVLIKLMVNFFNNIRAYMPCNKIKFYSVGHSNHGGDFEHSIVTALSFLLENIGVECYIATKSIDHFTIGNKTVIYTHGKDNFDQFKNFPLTLNEKTELYFNEYIDHHNLKGEIIVVKGDLHQGATTEGKKFSYRSVHSLFGGSNWIAANFGKTEWGCAYSTIDEFGEITDGIIKEQK